MLVALCMFIADSVLGTIYMRPLYDLVHLADGSFVPGPHFKEHTVMALRGFTGTAVLTNLGIFIIKLNFLLFFYRFGHQLPKFRALWWLVFVIVLASGAVQIGIIQFDCMLSDINTILITCSSSSHLRRNRQLFIVSVTLDIFTNFLSGFDLLHPFQIAVMLIGTHLDVVICFPVSIFWSSRLSLRQKLVLSAIFSLAGFTIVVTVFRGGFSLNTNEYPAVAGLSVAYNFWITLEYLVCKFFMLPRFALRHHQVVSDQLHKSVPHCLYCIFSLAFHTEAQQDGASGQTGSRTIAYTYE